MEHPRHYPVVNDDQTPHTFTIEWKQGNQTIAARSETLELPPVVRARLQGLGIEMNAPTAPGDYTVTAALDGKPLALRGGDGSVTVTGERQTLPVELVAVTLAPTQPKPGDKTLVTLWWRANERVPENYLIYVGLEDAQERVLFETTDNPLLAYRFPTGSWVPGELVPLEYELTVPGDLESGSYQLAIEVMDKDAARRFPFVLPDGSVQDRALIGFDIRE
jgi:hypothetical protein